MSTEKERRAVPATDEPFVEGHANLTLATIYQF